MFLFLVRQLWVQFQLDRHRCELISNYVLIFGSTTEDYDIQISDGLWIDFKLCSYFWFDNYRNHVTQAFYVVNWFQIMFLFLVRQPNPVESNHFCSCELISNYVLIFGSTTYNKKGKPFVMLWIDFKLCSYFWFDNKKQFSGSDSNVVNWFQIMFLFLVRQLFPTLSRTIHSCELISNYVLIFGSTTKLPSFPPA